MLNLTKKWSLIFFAASLTLSSSSSSSTPSSSFWSNSLIGDQTFTLSANQSLEFDFYCNSCPDAERIIRSTLLQLFRNQSTVAPAL
ncbi:hypothetical protein MKW98_024446, partial [Papaver atlanticum]